MIKIRNPWGHKEWDGDWSDRSKKWTASTRRQVNLQKKNDGTFWIAFADYVKFFYITTICYYNEQIVDNYLTDQHDLESYGMCKIIIDRDHPEPLTIAVDQVNARFLTGDLNYEYPAIRLVLTKLRAELLGETEGQVITQKYIHGCREADTHVALPLENGLKKGTYLLMYTAEFTQDNPERKLVVSCYCTQNVILERIAVEDYPPENY